MIPIHPLILMIMLFLESVPGNGGYEYKDVETFLQLTKVVYFEATMEPYSGKVAVAYNVLNRVRSDQFPDTVQEVVKQKYQYSFFWDGKPDQIDINNKFDRMAWHESIQAAYFAWSHPNKDPTYGALYYFNPKLVLPDWATNMTKTVSIGNHDFYKP